jgi:hypothetical protein
MRSAPLHEAGATTNEARQLEDRPWWREDLSVIVGVFATILIASQFADGTTRPEVMLGIAVLLGLIMRLTRLVLHRARSARHGRP